MKKAIVTGATGFVGSNLCKHLVRNDWKVTILSRASSDYSNINSLTSEIEVFEYDGNIEKLISCFRDVKPDVVFHVASLFIAEHNSHQIDKLLESNILFGLHVLEAMKESKTELMINTGTSWQHYQNNDYNPVNLYAATKQAFDCLMKFYIESEGLRLVTLKLFDTYGESDKRPKLMNLMKNFLYTGEYLAMTEGEQILNLVHIEDVVNAYLEAYEYLKNNKMINYIVFGVGSNSGIKLRDLISKFEVISGKKLNVKWGMKPYRKREVMSLWDNYDTIPNWEITVNLEEGIKRLLSEQERDNCI